MGPMFSSRKMRIFLSLIVVDLVVIGCAVFPVVPVSSSEIIFEFRDHYVEDNDFEYRWFKMDGGNKIHMRALRGR